ncbi:MAG: hypothetical protein ACRDVD_00335 [Acidimicrobiia bacterium]
MSYRLLYVGLGLLAVAAVALGVVFTQEGDPVELPPPIEAVSPDPGSTVIRQGTVEVDLEIGYEATIFVDGVPIPDPSFVPGTGVYSWSPTPASAVMTEWTPGDHTVVVEWRRITGTPAVGSFEWSFRSS